MTRQVLLFAALASAFGTSAGCARVPPGAGVPVADSGLVAVPGARIFYRSLGRGEPIIVVHGGPGMDHTYLLPGLAPLARDARLVLYDQRGGGRSEGEADRTSVSLDLFMGDITALADSLRIPRFVLMGHSFGGLLALHYAARHPERVRALVLMNTVEPGRRYSVQSADLLLRKRTPQDSTEMQALLQTEAMRQRDSSAVNALLRLSFRQLFADRSLADRLHISLDQRTVRNMAPVAMHLVGSMGTYDFWPLVSGIRTPALIVHGVEDAVPQAMPRELQRTISGSELVLVEGAGHFPYIEQPDVTFGAVRRFLAGIR